MATRSRWRLLPGWLKRLSEIGVLTSDSEELRVRKTVLVLSSTLMASLSFVWVATYATLGLWICAAIPFVYQFATVVSIVTFARTRRFILFRRSQLCMSLLLPFALQWSLGGFELSSAVCLWGVTAPLGALLFVGARQAIPWFAAFAALVVFSAAIDQTLFDGAEALPHGVVIAFFALNIVGVAATALHASRARTSVDRASLGAIDLWVKFIILLGGRRSDWRGRIPRVDRIKTYLVPWLPAILMMAVIFLVSSEPSSALPNFSWADTFVKKGGHMLGYGILAWSYWRGLRYRLRMRPLAWLLAVSYAVTDELHQSFVPGRHPSPVDVLLFDGLGALFALTLLPRWLRTPEDGGNRGS
jgi:VanZ family protein